MVSYNELELNDCVVFKQLLANLSSHKEHYNQFMNVLRAFLSLIVSRVGIHSILPPTQAPGQASNPRSVLFQKQTGGAGIICSCQDHCIPDKRIQSI